MLKYRIVRLFPGKDSRDILTEPGNLFEKHLEPVRPGRKYEAGLSFLCNIYGIFVFPGGGEIFPEN